MKKVIFALGLVLALTSCGGAATGQASKADSTAVTKDTVKLDTAKVAVAVDTTKATK